MNREQTQVFDTPEQIALYTVCALKAALRLEVAGMKKRGTSAFQMARGIVGGRTKKETLALLSAHVERELARHVAKGFGGA